ncbi:MAG: hypothetical protein AAF962_02900 [Actinomycetota bacterium]
MGRNSDMLTTERIRREALRQLDTELDRCTDRLPSLEELESAALIELAAAAGDSLHDEPAAPDLDMGSDEEVEDDGHRRHGTVEPD